MVLLGEAVEPFQSGSMADWKRHVVGLGIQPYFCPRLSVTCSVFCKKLPSCHCLSPGLTRLPLSTAQDQDSSKPESTFSKLILTLVQETGSILKPSNMGLGDVSWVKCKLGDLDSDSR